MRSLHLIQDDAVIADEGLVQVVDANEVGAAVLVGLAHEVGLDEVEDDLAEVAGPVDAPHAEYRAGHQAKLAQGEIPDAVEQLRPADMVLDNFFLLERLFRRLLRRATE